MQAVRFHVDPETPSIKASWGDRELALPALWLRERCRDLEHVDPHTGQRLFNPHELSDDLALTDLDNDESGGVWLSLSDGYRGC